MATQTSLLPVYHEDPSIKSSSELNMDVDLSSWMTQQPNPQDEAFLQELLSGQGDDLLSSLLESTPGSTNPSSTSIGAPLTFDFDATLGGVQANVLPTSPVGSDGYTSDSYSITNGGSPLTNMNGGGSAPVVAENLGASPQQQLTESPSHSPSPFMSSALPVTDPSQMAMDPSLDFSDFNGVDLTSFMTSDATISSTSLSPPQAPPTTSTATSTITNSLQPSSSTSNDIRIDVEPHSSGMRGSVSSDVSAASPQSSSYSPSPPSASSDRKAATLLLSDEEKRLLAAEGVSLPTDMPLTKAEQKQLKRVQRKIKNKISAQESRKRKKNYVDGLEERVKICTERNQELKREVDCLKSENQSLLAQLKKLQTIVLQYNPSRAQAGTVVMVLILSFSLFLVPRMKYFAPGKGVGRGASLAAMNGFSRHSRTLLFTATDDFGNVIDPETGKIISPVGGQSPSPPLPWVYQTPAILFEKINRTLSSRVASTGEERGDEKEAPSLNDSWLRKSDPTEHIETTDEL